jgi:hypothetical protein
MAVPKLGLFIEVCGSEEFDYAYRKTIYEKNGNLIWQKELLRLNNKERLNLRS